MADGPFQNDQVAGEVNDTVEQAKGVARDAANAVSDAASKASGTLREAAGSVRDAAQRSEVGRSVFAFADDASERLAKTADYVRDTESAVMWRDFVGYVKARPVESLAAAVMLGFVVGRAGRRS